MQRKTNSTSERKEEKHQKKEIYNLLSLIMDVGVTMAVSIVLFVLLGSWLDKKYGYKAFFTVVGIFLGIGGGFYNTYRLLKKL
jgi:ATP synthase protein I